MVTDDTAGALGRRLALAQSSSRLPSLVAALAKDGAIAWFGAAGEIGGSAPNESTQYRCGSISKTFVAVAVMRLRDEGLLELNDPIGVHLPELSGFPASVAQLLSHTSGLRAETSGPWWERTPGRPFAELVTSSIRPEDVLSRPGRRFHYSNVGYAILGELVARLRGARWDEVVAHELLGPLEMARTTFRPVPPHASGHGVHPHADVWLPEPEHEAASMAPAGQIWTTVEDLATWSAVLAGD
ncbi:MAG TPA: serine hydrolase domain-containing protein, partial [Acidimicrobiales bacterium]|nr:serine hydrolase domain-containing protein [Acidimicrobiales bacterium]